MTVTNLSWYICVVLVVGSLMLSVMSVAPGGERFVYWLLIGFVSGAALAATTAIVLRRLSPDHWVRTSKPLLTLSVFLAAAATLAVALIG